MSEIRAFPTVDRRTQSIFALSLVLHLAIFALLSLGRPVSPPALPPIMASLRQMVVDESPAPAALPRPAAVAPLPKARQSPSLTASRSVLATTRTAGPTSVRQPAPAPAVVNPAAPAEAPGSQALASVPMPNPPPAATAQAQPPTTPAPTRPQGDLLAAYRARLSQLFANRQEYPRIAALRGWEGEVQLRLTVARKGNLIAVHLDRSSGFDVLDRSALAFVEALSGLPPLPEALEANEIQVVVPVHYKLRKTT